MATALHDDGPSAVRYPRGEGVGLDLPDAGEVLPIGVAVSVRAGERASVAWHEAGTMPDGRRRA